MYEIGRRAARCLLGERVRRYGMDIVQRLSRAGLKVEARPYARQFSKAEQERFGLDAEEYLFICHT